MKVGRIVESYTAFAEARSSESLFFAINRNLDDARLKHFSKWVFRFNVLSISIPRYLYCLVFSIFEHRYITSSVSLCFEILCEFPKRRDSVLPFFQINYQSIFIKPIGHGLHIFCELGFDDFQIFISNIDHCVISIFNYPGPINYISDIIEE